MVLVVLAGCTSREIDSRLVQVNDLANSNKADSAMLLLEEIDKFSLNEYNSRYHDLMTIKTRDKAYLDIKNDTLITEIIRYFEDNGADDVKGEAYYYGGRVYREIGDAPQALDYFQKALDVLDDTHIRLKGKISSQMGQLFNSLNMVEQANGKFHDAIHYGKLCNDSVGMMFDYLNLGENYKWLEKYDSIMPCYDVALDLVQRQAGYGLVELEIRVSRIDYYLLVKDFDSAIEEYKLIENRLNNKAVTSYILTTAVNVCILKKDYAQAEALSNRLIEKNIYGKEFAYGVLADIAKSKKDTKRMYEYIAKYKACLDSVDRNASREAVIHQNSFYNYSLREKENLTLRNERLKTYLVSLSIALALLCVIFAVILMMKDIKRINKKLGIENKELLQNNDELANSCNQLQESNEDLKSENRELEGENKRLLTEQEQTNVYLAQQLNKIETLETNIKVLQENLSAKEITRKIEQQLLSRLENIDSDNFVVDNKIAESGVYLRIKEIIGNGKGRVSARDWSELDAIVNEVYPDFKNKIFYLNSTLSPEDYHLCLLIKCDFAIRDIAKLTYRSTNAITNHRKRLYGRLFGIDGAPSDLDKYIISL